MKLFKVLMALVAFATITGCGVKVEVPPVINLGK